MKAVREYETLLDKEQEETDAQEALKQLDAFLFVRDADGNYVVGKKGKKQIAWTNVVFQIWRLVFLIRVFLDCLTKPDTEQQSDIQPEPENPKKQQKGATEQRKAGTENTDK